MAVSNYPTMNLGTMRAMVRDITNIEATLVVSNSRIDQLLNEEMLKVIRSVDVETTSLTTSTVVISGTTYRYPGWKWENLTSYPTSASAIYMNSDADRTPWSVSSTASTNSGFYDRGLVYKVAARILAEQSDDTNRTAEFNTRGDEILTSLVRDEFINWNANLAGNVTTTYPNDEARQITRLTLLVMQLLRLPQNWEVGIDTFLIQQEIQNESVELYNAYAWPVSIVNSNVTSWSIVDREIFAYGVAARLAPRFDISEAEQKSFLANYETRKQNLLRKLIYNSSGAIQPYTFAGLKAQVRALLQDYTLDLPETLIGQWINDAYQTLAYEREWRWLEQEVTVNVPAGSATIDLTYGSRILSMYEIKFDDNGNIKESGQIYPVGHGYDVLNNASDYRYSMDASFVDNMFMSDSVVTIFPTPKEPIVVGIRFAETPGPLTLNNSATLIGTQFASILAYRAAVVGAAFHPQAKQLIPAYEAQAQRIYDSMLRHYQLDTSTETFSIGENALETRKYLPFFRVG